MKKVKNYSTSKRKRVQVSEASKAIDFISHLPWWKIAGKLVTRQVSHSFAFQSLFDSRVDRGGEHKYLKQKISF